MNKFALVKAFCLMFSVGFLLAGCDSHSKPSDKTPEAPKSERPLSDDQNELQETQTPND